MDICFGLYVTFFTTFIPRDDDYMNLMPGMHLIPHPVTYDTGFRYEADSIINAGSKCSEQRDYQEGFDGYEILQGVKWWNSNQKEKYDSSGVKLHCLPVKCTNK